VKIKFSFNEKIENRIMILGLSLASEGMFTRDRVALSIAGIGVIYNHQSVRREKSSEIIQILSGMGPYPP
jgi:hypothetical protein